MNCEDLEKGIKGAIIRYKALTGFTANTLYVTPKMLSELEKKHGIMKRFLGLRVRVHEDGSTCALVIFEDEIAS